MSLADIEAELEHLNSDELQRLAIKSWQAFVQKQGGSAGECDEQDPGILAALDAAITLADANPRNGATSIEARTRLNEWMSSR